MYMKKVMMGNKFGHINRSSMEHRFISQHKFLIYAERKGSQKEVFRRGMKPSDYVFKISHFELCGKWIVTR